MVLIIYSSKMTSFEDIEKMIDAMEPIPLKEYLVDDYGTFDKDFETDLIYDIQEIQKENDDALLYEFEVFEQEQEQNDIHKTNTFRDFITNLPEIISVNQISEINYTVYTYEYIDNLIEYYNILKIYSNEFERLNRLKMSEQSKKNFLRRMNEYLDKCKIKKQIIVLESPIDICIELDLTNNEICTYHYKSDDINKNIMIYMTYVNINIQKYVLDINITYTLLHIIYFRKIVNCVNLHIIEEIIKYFSNSHDYYENKKFTKKELYLIYCNMKNIINVIKRNPVKYSLHT